MRLLRTERFKKDFRRLPVDIHTRAAKALELFVTNPRHPSLGIKKMEGAPGIWELRVTQGYRMTFQRLQGGLLLRRIGTHDILRQP